MTGSNLPTETPPEFQDWVHESMAKRAQARQEPPALGFSPQLDQQLGLQAQQVAPAQQMPQQQTGDQADAVYGAANQGNPMARKAITGVQGWVGNNKEAERSALNFLGELPDDIDPGNSYQFNNAMAQWSRQSGYNKVQLNKQTSNPALEMPSDQQLQVQDLQNIVAGKGGNFLGLKQGAAKDIADLQLRQAQVDKLDAITSGRIGGGTTAFAMAMQQINSDPELSKLPTETKIRLAQNAFSKDTTIDSVTGQQVVQPGAVPSRTSLSRADQTGTLEADLSLKPTIAGNVKASELGTQKAFDAPKAQARIKSTLAKSKSVINKIDLASSKVNEFTAGYGALWQKWPSSSARDLAADLNTIKANLGFDELNEMRQNSPTGGALGQVAVQEIEFLQSVVANLEQSQSPEQLRQNLSEVRQAKIDSDARIQAAYDADFGRFAPTDSGAPTEPSGAKRIKYDAQGNRVP